LAHSAYLTHGTTAYAFALDVDDAEATVVRAQALGAKTFQQPVGPSEMIVPAIRGIGGGLIYFLDQKSPLSGIWDLEFIPVEDDRETGDAGLLAIDHIAQTMPYDQMLSWLLFYTSIFETRKTPLIDIIDPAGIVRSQVIENAEQSLRITMNGAENQATVAGRFVADSFGSGIQHVAFATRDIFATAEYLRSRGIAPLAITSNYYDDIEARFGLDPALVETLRHHNILYDRDADGEYLQLYGTTFGQGLFFEIVERRGYAGYGAPNAPFRIAAQRRQMPPMTMPKPPARG
jgi:4-hydroxyphenylpyruvate dioxygenase